MVVYLCRRPVTGGEAHEISVMGRTASHHVSIFAVRECRRRPWRRPDEYPSLFPDCSVGLDSHGYLGTAGCSSAGALSGAIRFAGTIGNPCTARNGTCPTPGRDQISRRFTLD